MSGSENDRSLGRVSHATAATDSMSAKCVSTCQGSTTAGSDATEPTATEPIASEPPANEPIAPEPPANGPIAPEPPANEATRMFQLTDSHASMLRPDALSPAEIEQKAESLAPGKATMPAGKLFILAVLAGAFIACGATLFTLVQGDTQLPFAIKRVFGAACFSMGLMLVVCCGAELFTGNCLMVCGLGSRKINIKGLLRNWCIVYAGNFAGSLLIACLVYGTSMANMNGGEVGAAMVSIASGKVSPCALVLFCKGVMCNFLVCLAVWMSFGARTMVDKLLCVIMPVTAFVACGFEHSIANMFFLFEGFFAQAGGFGAGGITFEGIFYNLGVVTFANLVGGAVLVGASYWFAYARCKN